MVPDSHGSTTRISDVDPHVVRRNADLDNKPAFSLRADPDTDADPDPERQKRRKLTQIVPIA